jgi:hypothetical protein
LIRFGSHLKTLWATDPLEMNKPVAHGGVKKVNRKKEHQLRSGDPQILGQILRKALNQRNLSLHLKDQQLVEAWNRAVGKTISAQARVDRLDRDTLLVKVSSPAWMQQLQFVKSDIQTKLNEILGKESVRNIYFSIGEVAPVRQKKTGPLALMLDQNLLKDRDKRLIEECTASISDGELHEILKRAMTRNIIRRRMEDRRKSP